MRFSLTEVKLAIARLLMQFKLEPARGTKFPPQLRLTVALLCINAANVMLRDHADGL